MRCGRAWPFFRRPTAAAPSTFTPSTGHLTLRGAPGSYSVTLSLSVDATTKVEGSTFVGTITRTGSTVPEVSVFWYVQPSGCTPAPTSDFGPSYPGSLVVLPSGVSSITFDVVTIDGATYLANRQFDITLTDESMASPGTVTLGTSSVTCTITDNDLPAINFGASTTTIPYLRWDMCAGGSMILGDTVFEVSGNGQFVQNGSSMNSIRPATITVTLQYPVAPEAGDQINISVFDTTDTRINSVNLFNLTPGAATQDITITVNNNPLNRAIGRMYIDTSPAGYKTVRMTKIVYT